MSSFTAERARRNWDPLLGHLDCSFRLYFCGQISVQSTSTLMKDPSESPPPALQRGMMARISVLSTLFNQVILKKLKTLLNVTILLVL